MPVLANIEAIWIIIVIVSVIAQIVKGAKKISGPKQPGVGPDRTSGGNAGQRDFVAPDAALQDFLKSLTGESAVTVIESPKPRPQTPMRAAGPASARSAALQPQRRPPPRRVINPPAHRPIQAPAITAVPPPLQVPARTYMPVVFHTEESTEVTLESTASTGLPAHSSLLGEELRRDLASIHSVRKAILLREILGPPLALR